MTKIGTFASPMKHYQRSSAIQNFELRQDSPKQHKPTAASILIIVFGKIIIYNFHIFY